MKSLPGKRLLSKVIYDSRGNALMRAVPLSRQRRAFDGSTCSSWISR